MQTTSWLSIKSRNLQIVFCSTSADWQGCPGMGTSSSWCSASASGITASTASRAHLAFDLPSAASWCVNKLWRTGFEKDTFPESTKVNFRTPQPINVRATLQPKVPEPRSRNLRFFIFSGSMSGKIRHLMSLTLRSTASEAMRFTSMKTFRSTDWIFDQPANWAAAGGGSVSTASACALLASTKKTRERTAASLLACRCGSLNAKTLHRPGRW
mmetsp:Transcript_87524/g.151562  ORF Transcript_87524/g.151562 Transcript_87524/m.151562 type:complete len:213 (-) Transcript_87524:296-934(-)